jgi:hypothetical protein
MAATEQSRSPYSIAILAGAVLWFGAAALGGRREAWDSTLYWAVAYPIGLIVSGWLGHHHPQRAWRWALALMVTQAFCLALSGSDFGLLPLGVVMFAVLAVPGMGLAQLAARRRQRADEG